MTTITGEKRMTRPSDAARCRGPARHASADDAHPPLRGSAPARATRRARSAASATSILDRKPPPSAPLPRCARRPDHHRLPGPWPSRRVAWTPAPPWRRCTASSPAAKGKGGSMHLFDKPHHMYGGHAIVAGQCPLGIGLAFGIQYQKKDNVCLCYLGDGALNQGASTNR